MPSPGHPIARHLLPARVLIGALFLLLTANIRADSPHLIDLWTPYEGLPQSRVLSIAQTPDGYLWISTQLGWIARFDGIRFDHFNPNNTPALVSPEIQKIMVDDRGVLWLSDVDGRLLSVAGGRFREWTTGKPGYDKRVVNWIGRSGNENRFSTASGILLRVGEQVAYENEGSTAGPRPEVMKQFCQDAEGVLWCRSAGGEIGHWRDGRLQPLADGVLPTGVKVNHLLAMPRGGLWLATNHGLWRLGNNRAFQIRTVSEGLEKSIDQLAPGPDGSLRMLAGKTLIEVRGDEVVRSTPLPGLGNAIQGRTNEMHTDSEGGTWIVNFGGGVWHVDATGELTVLNTRTGLPSNQVETWFEDREKNIWLGTAAGLVRVRPRWFQIVDTLSGGSGSGVVSICENPAGQMWLGRANGLTRWTSGVAADLPLPDLRANVSIADVTVAPGKAAEEVWLGTVQSGTFRLRDGVIEQPFPLMAAGQAIRVVRRDPEGGIWFGGEFGLYRWDGRHLRRFGPESGLAPGHIHDISFGADGTAWIAKADDLLVVFRNGRFEAVPLPGVSPSIRIHTVLCGKGGNVWLGTVGAGLLHLSGHGLVRYSREDGLPSDSVSQLLEDDDGHLWGGTLRGIFRVPVGDLERRSRGDEAPVLFRNYDHSDGLPTAECSGGLQPACWKAADGRLWFSTSTGAVVVDPRQIRKNLAPPAAVIEQLRINGVPREIRSDAGKNAIHRIGPGLHRFEFLFTGLSFTAPEKVRFQWNLEGVDAGWIDGGRQRNVAYSGLEPGDYRFSVRAANSDGVWSREPASVRFTVAPYFWQRASVRAGLTAGGLTVSYLLVTGIMRRKHARALRFVEYERSLEQQRFRHKAAMEAERARIAAELHDDLGADLTQIQWLGECAGASGGPPTEETELLLRVARKSREMVRLMDQIVWAVNPKNDTLDHLVTYICNFAEQYFRDSATRCRIDVAEPIPGRELKADVRHHLFLIAKEALHNVAKHAATDRVWVRVTCRDGDFKLVIEDRGRGFDLASAGAGDGLANMKKRARLAGAGLDIDSAPGRGTRVTLGFSIHPPSV